MNMLQFLFGRAVRARRPRAEILSPPAGRQDRRIDGKPVGKRNAAIYGLSPILGFVVSILLGATQVRADVLAGWALTSNGTGTNLANVTAGTFGIGSGVGPNLTYGATGAYTTNWTTGASVDLSDYYTFTVAPNSGYQLSVTNLGFGNYRSGTGIRWYEVRYSTNAFSSYTSLTSSNVPDNTSERTISTNCSIVVNNGHTLEFRI